MSDQVTPSPQYPRDDLAEALDTPLRSQPQSGARSPALATFTRYYTGSYGKPIVEVECSRETAKSVWVLEKSWTMRGGYSGSPVERRREKAPDFHDTWEAAHAYLMEKAAAKLEWARRELERAQGHFGNIKGMRKQSQAASDASG
jgi:hypothetical protein